MDKLKVGLIGLGAVADIHLEAYKNIRNIDIVSGSDHKREKAVLKGKKWSFNAYVDTEEMLDKEKLDIVVNLTPAREHRKTTELAASYGVHVLCEKPLAVTIEDALAMIQKCKQGQVHLCYGASYRYLPVCQKAKELIERGSLGELSLLFEMVLGGQGLENFKELGNHHYPKGGPGGGGAGLIDHGIHLVDLFSWLTDGDVQFVAGKGNYSGKSPGTECLTMFFKNGAIGQLVYNELSYPTKLPSEGVFSWGLDWDDKDNLVSKGCWNPSPGNICIHGSSGSLRLFHYANKLFLSDREGQSQIGVEGMAMPGNFTRQMESFVSCILKDNEPETTGYDGLRALQIVLAAYESFKTKRFVEIEPMTSSDPSQ